MPLWCAGTAIIGRIETVSKVYGPAQRIAEANAGGLLIFQSASGARLRLNRWARRSALRKMKPQPCHSPVLRSVWFSWCCCSPLGLATVLIPGLRLTTMRQLEHHWEFGFSRAAFRETFCYCVGVEVKGLVAVALAALGAFEASPPTVC
jgi:hypothetical protein